MSRKVLPYCPPDPPTSGGVESWSVRDPNWHPPGQMFPGRRDGTRGGGLGCCNTMPKNDDGSPIVPGAAAAPVASGFDLSALPDWVKYAAIAVGIYLLVKK